ncbi:arsinothricin resistance N-acetyltransferase ArsN1 family B [Halocatena marina]|uniref:Arsinothricin resistance N-acetyltransferase ArsN1 family B n=1 Tax=Halocatena marina TaxID=2934937 RepID=A0ABD5YN36_9EURY|nr:arsinothricin resistance N-acetyltransferase ArsN1 family B [Halocatena marina]
MAFTIRLATEDDAGPIQEIYAPYVRDTVISFEREPPSVEEVRHRIRSTLKDYPWLVGELDGEVIGYAYTGKHRTRDAYQWSVDSSVYVRPDHHRSGIARGLYESLFELLTLQGFFNVYAGITLPTPASVGFHESMGYQPIGVYKNVGHKHGAWHDVKWWHRSLGDPAPDPERPTSLQEVQSHEGWDDAIGTGVQAAQL